MTDPLEAGRELDRVGRVTVAELIALLQALPAEDQRRFVYAEGCDCVNPINGTVDRWRNLEEQDVLELGVNA